MTAEKELIDRLPRGNMPAFRELVEAYKKKMYYFALDMVRDPADAETMQISIGSVKSYLFRCLRKLQKELAVPSPPGQMEVSDEGL